GARFDDTAADDAGAAYLLDPVTGALVATLEAPSAAASDQLGSAVAALGGDLFIGAPHFNDSGAAHAGTVFVFRGGTVSVLSKPRIRARATSSAPPWRRATRRSSSARPSTTRLRPMPVPSTSSTPPRARSSTRS